MIQWNKPSRKANWTVVCTYFIWYIETYVSDLNWVCTEWERETRLRCGACVFSYTVQIMISSWVVCSVFLSLSWSRSFNRAFILFYNCTWTPGALSFQLLMCLCASNSAVYLSHRWRLFDYALMGDPYTLRFTYAQFVLIFFCIIDIITMHTRMSIEGLGLFGLAGCWVLMAGNVEFN